MLLQNKSSPIVDRTDKPMNLAKALNLKRCAGYESGSSQDLASESDDSGGDDDDSNDSTKDSKEIMTPKPELNLSENQNQPQSAFITP